MRYDAIPLEVAGEKYFFRLNLGAMQILQRRLGLKTNREILEFITSVIPIPGAFPEGEDTYAFISRAVAVRVFETNPTDFSEVLWAGLYQSGGAARYPGPQDVLQDLDLPDMSALLVPMVAAAMQAFSRPASEALASENPQEAAPSPSP